MLKWRLNYIKSCEWYSRTTTATKQKLKTKIIDCSTFKRALNFIPQKSRFDGYKLSGMIEWMDDE